MGCGGSVARCPAKVSPLGPAVDDQMASVVVKQDGAALEVPQHPRRHQARCRGGKPAQRSPASKDQDKDHIELIKEFNESKVISDVDEPQAIFRSYDSQRAAPAQDYKITQRHALPPMKNMHTKHMHKLDSFLEGVSSHPKDLVSKVSGKQRLHRDRLDEESDNVRVR
eukprot:gb/GFBE01023652.1/.p1 GENE.gb/GFBE01023652.1/~~gb/GFBE01023652.1/.p1  ORF type:complete len:168 (+),score=24.54 gb/GFBE01023652.1/:1-504(+)